MSKFTITPDEMHRLTGYHRNSQWRFRDNGVLVNGEHYTPIKSDNPKGRVLYSEKAVAVLKARRLTAKPGRPKTKNEKIA